MFVGLLKRAWKVNKIQEFPGKGTLQHSRPAHFHASQNFEQQASVQVSKFVAKLSNLEVSGKNHPWFCRGQASTGLGFNEFCVRVCGIFLESYGQPNPCFLVLQKILICILGLNACHDKFMHNFLTCSLYLLMMGRVWVGPWRGFKISVSQRASKLSLGHFLAEGAV